MQAFIEGEDVGSSMDDNLLITLMVKQAGYRVVRVRTSLRTMECFSSSIRPMIDMIKSNAS
jgi:hypothetical protein